jgi:hypothetical protein
VTAREDRIAAMYRQVFTHQTISQNNLNGGPKDASESDFIRLRRH